MVGFWLFALRVLLVDANAAAAMLAGIVLDLQVIRPNPAVEVDGRVVCEINGEPLFRKADAATAAIEALSGSGRLVEHAIDDHDVREHFDNGADLIATYADKTRELPDNAPP
jgi:hypothetical protein